MFLFFGKRSSDPTSSPGLSAPSPEQNCSPFLPGHPRRSVGPPGRTHGSLFPVNDVRGDPGVRFCALAVCKKARWIDIRTPQLPVVFGRLLPIEKPPETTCWGVLVYIYRCFYFFTYVEYRYQCGVSMAIWMMDVDFPHVSTVTLATWVLSATVSNCLVVTSLQVVKAQLKP